MGDSERGINICTNITFSGCAVKDQDVKVFQALFYCVLKIPETVSTELSS